MIGRLFTGLINQTLDAEPALQGRLLPHAGKHVRLVLPGFAGLLKVTASGRVERVVAEAPHASLRIPLDALLEWQSDRIAARRRIILEGDSECALAVADILGHAHLNAEELLSRLVGDMAAHRILKIWRDRQDRRSDRWQRLTETVTDYMQFESRLIVTKPEVEAFCHNVDHLRDDVARLEQRVTQCEKNNE